LVEFVLTLGVYQVGIDLEAVLKAIAEAGAAGVIGITVVIGLEGEASAGLRDRAAARVESRRVEPARTEIEPAAIAAPR